MNLTIRLHRRTGAVSFRMNGHPITRDAMVALWSKAAGKVWIARDIDHVRAMRAVEA